MIETRGGFMPRRTLRRRMGVIGLLLLLCGAAWADEPVLNRLDALEVRETDQATEIVVKGSVPPTFTVFKLTDPIRLFVDISNADARALGNTTVGNGVVETVKTAQFDDDLVRIARIEVELASDAPYDVVAQGNGIMIRVDASQRAEKRPVAAVGPTNDAAVRARVAAAESRAQDAERRARAAEAALAAARRAEDSASKATADAQAAESRALQAEARAREAEQDAARARSQARSATAEAKQVAESRAIEAESRAAEAEDRAREAEARAAEAEAAAVAARGQARAAADAADSRADDAEARAVAAAEQARRQAAEAEKRARQAEQRASEAEKAAALAKKQSRDADSAQARAAEAEARAKAAEARAAAAEADKQRLAGRLSALEAEKNAAARQIQSLEGNREALARQLEAARAANDAAKTRALEAEQAAREARIAAEKAEVARIDSATEAGKLESRVKRLEREVAGAKAEGTGDADELDAELMAARAEARALEQTLAAREAALAQAREAARQSRAEADRLEGTLARTEAEKDAARQEAEQAQARIEAEKAARQEAEKAAADKAGETAAGAAAAAGEPTPQQTRITEVRFDDGTDRTRVRVRFEGTPDYTLKREGDRTRILEFADALIEPALERSLDTSEFGSAVQLVSSFQAPPPGDRVRVVVTLSAAVDDQIALDGDALVWSFDRPRARRPVAATPAAPAWQAPAPPAREVRYEQPRAAVFTGPGQTISLDDSSRPKPARRKRYTGRKINIDIKDGDLHNILRLLAKEGNVNIVTSDDVDGTITMHLKLVPWDQALDIILRTKGLDMVREGDIIRVAPAEVIAQERENELKKLEVKEKLKPLEVKLITVNHANASDLLPRVRSVLSERGTVEQDERTNTVIIKDVDDHLAAAEDLIRRLDTQTPQVLIEARIVEVNDVNDLELGIQWGLDAIFSAATGNPTGLRFPSSVGVAGGGDDPQTNTEGNSTNPNYVVNLPAAAGLGSGGALGITLGSVDSTFNLNLRLSALENRGTVKVISSPKIATLDNKQAEISQGTSIPISQVSAAGVQTVFFDATLKLLVTPHVTQDGNIYLEIETENNTPDFQNVGARGDPTILKKTAKTELLIRDGDTTVIGGIYTSQAGYNHAEVPYLARIPILGALFRNYRESDRRTELLIFVTPRIINRAASTVQTAP